jgi:hypothetical protein
MILLLKSKTANLKENLCRQLEIDIESGNWSTKISLVFLKNNAIGSSSTNCMQFSFAKVFFQLYTEAWPFVREYTVSVRLKQAQKSKIRQE